MKVLAIGAHFDDVELGCGGTLLKHRDRGDDIYIVVITHSAYESPAKGCKRRKEIARAEGEKSAVCRRKDFSVCSDKPSLPLWLSQSIFCSLAKIIPPD